MKRLIFLAVFCLLFSACSPNIDTSHPSESQPTSHEQSDIPADDDGIIDSFLQTSYPVDMLDISEIERANIIGEAWKDIESIYFLTLPAPAGDIQGYTVEVHHYDTNQQKLHKVFEFTSDDIFKYVYIQVQDNGDLALKHPKGFTIVSGKDYNVAAEIVMPDNADYSNYSISYDGSKIALAHSGETRLEILDAKTLAPLQSVISPDAAYLQIPKWTVDGTSILLYPRQHGFIDAAYAFDLTDGQMKKFDFSGYINEYDNEVFLGGQSAFRMDVKDNSPNDPILQFEKFDFATSQSTFWEFDAPMPPYMKSISEKGYMVAHVYHNNHYLYIADINGQRMVKTEEALSGGTLHPPVWARNQEQALILLTLEKSGAYPKWAAAVVDCKEILSQTE